MEYYLSPSILSVDLDKLAEAVRGLIAAGIKWIHVDVMDGHFVPNMTFGPRAVEAIRNLVPDDIVVDAHLMIERPELWAPDYCKAGANFVTVHAEATVHLHRVLQSIKEEGVAAGASLNPATPVSVLFDILPDLDVVLVMSVNPGFGGQKFIPGALKKIKELREKIDELGLDCIIQVDGGIKIENVGEVTKAGANNFVSGSGVFGHESAKDGDYTTVVKAFMDEIMRAAAG